MKKSAVFAMLFFVLLIALSSAADRNYTETSLEPSTNVTFMIEIQGLLNSYHYNAEYGPTVFDCSDSSIYTILFLKNTGFNPIAVTDYLNPKNSKVKQCHMWVAVPDDKNRYLFIETTADYHRSLGEVIWRPYKKNGYDYTKGLITSEPVEFLLKCDPAQKKTNYSLVDGVVEPNIRSDIKLWRALRKRV